MKHETFQLPTSGPILKTLVEIFQLRDVEDSCPAALRGGGRRYFQGERVADDTRSEIMSSIARAFLEAGFTPPNPETSSEALERSLTLSIGLYAACWDGIGNCLPNRSIDGDPQAVALAYLRLVAVDLALRCGAYRWLAGVGSVEPPAMPNWTSQRTRQEYRDRLLADCNPPHSVEELRKQLGYAKQSVIKRWVEAKVRSKRETILNIADSLADRLGRTTEEVRQELLWHHALSDLVDHATRLVGESEVLELVSAFERIAGLVGVVLESSGRAASEPTAIMLMSYGSKWPFVGDLLGQVSRMESDPPWREEILSVNRHWFFRVLFASDAAKRGAALVASAPDAVDGAELTQLADYLQRSLLAFGQAPEGLAPTSEAPAEIQVEYLLAQTMFHLSRGSLGVAVAKARQATKLNRQSAQAHSVLGIVAGQLASTSETPADLYREAEEACWLAYALAKDQKVEWEQPLVTLSHLLLSQGRRQEALDLLEDACGQRIANPSNLILFPLAVARMSVGDRRGALDAAKIVAERDETNIGAHELAAICCGLLGLKGEFKRYAHRARNLGARLPG